LSTGPNFEAVMSGDGKWKLHVPHKYQTLVRAGRDGAPGEYRTTEIGLALYDMEGDPYEKNNVLEQHTDIARRLLAYAEEHRREFYPETPALPGM
jgi:arylsulfatase A